MKTGYAQPMPVRNEYLVRERDRKRARESIMVLALVFGISAPLLGYTWLQLEVRAIGFRIKTTERELVGLRNLERRLQLEVSRRENPFEIEARATEELGLVPPRLDQMIFTVVEGTP